MLKCSSGETMGKANEPQPSPTQTVALHAWGWQWAVVPRWRALFGHDEQIPWETLGRYDRAEPIKANDLRSVWRVRVGEQTVMAKVYQPPRWWARFKAMLLGPAGRREFRAALYGRQHNLSVVRPIAYGRHSARAAGRFVLLTEVISNAQTLSAYWLGRSDSSGRGTLAIDNAIVSRVAALLERLHRGKFVPMDLHPDNILVTEEEDVVLVDLHKARFGVTATEILRILNLADLNQWFGHHATRTTRLRFLLAYLTYAVEKPSPRLIRKYLTEIDEVTGWKAEKLEKKRDKRIFGDNRYFGVLSLPDDWTAHVYLQAKRPVSGSSCSQLQFAKSDWADTLTQMLAAGLSSAGSNPAEMQIGPHEVPIRIERAADLSDVLRGRWQREHKKINRHQAVPLPLVLLQHRPGGRKRDTILITERSDER